jgi:hypothetical protein
MGMMGIPSDQARAIRERQMSHDLYRSGLDHYNGEYDEAAMSHWVNQLAGQPTVSPWINVTDDSRRSTYDAFMEDNYNPFIGNEGAWVTPDGNDLRGSNNGTAEGYRDDSISAYLKQAFSGQDQVQNRANALRAFKKWNGTERGINTATTRMNRQHFDDLGLGEFGLEWEAPESGASKMLNGTTSDGPSKAAQMLSNGYGGASSAGTGEMTYANPNQNPGDPSWLDQFREADRNGAGGRAGEMLRGGLMSGGGDAMRDVIYGKAQEKIFGE